MSEPVIKSFTFSKGLQTKHSDEGRTGPDEFIVFQNARVGKGGVKRRGGIAKVATASSDNSSVRFASGSSQYLLIPLDTRVHQLGVRWTFETLVTLDTLSGNHYIYGNEASATPSLTLHVTSAGKVIATVYLVGGSSTTLTSSSSYSAGALLEIQVKRDGASLVLYVNGASEATGTVSATVLGQAPTTGITIGRHAGGSYFNGDIDYVRCFNIARPTYGDLMFRWSDPRCSYCLWDYTGEIDANGRVLDRSRWANHTNRVSTTGTPVEAAAGGYQHAHVQVIHPRVNRDGEPEIIVVAGGRIHTVEVV